MFLFKQNANLGWQVRCSSEVADSESGGPQQRHCILTCCIHGLDTLHLSRVVVPRHCITKPLKGNQAGLYKLNSFDTIGCIYARNLCKIILRQSTQVTQQVLRSISKFTLNWGLTPLFTIFQRYRD